MSLSKPSWELVHGPDHSHDALESARFDRFRDAMDVALALAEDRCWRLLRISGGKNYTPHDVKCMARGGPDEVAKRQRAAFKAQYKTAKG